MSELERASYGVLLAGFAGPDVPAWLPRAYDRGLAGTCLYGNNVAPGRDLAGLARSVRALAPTAVLAADEEGGDVTRLHATTGSPYAGAAALGRYDDPATTRLVAEGIGAELAAAGIWLDLAPCADVNSDPLNPVIGTRSFGTGPGLVARHTVAFVEGLASSGVAACVKHFPGHGDTRTDSHHGLPTVRARRDVLESRELVPFRAAVEAGAPTVMTSHVVLEGIDPDRPATFSPVVLRDLLRGELGFEGVVVTDALDMAGASQGRGIAEAAVLALAAGADLLCLGPGDERCGPVLVRHVARAVTAAVEDGTLPAERLLDAAERVGRLRAGWSRGRGRGGADRAEVVQRARDASAQVADATVSGVRPLAGSTVIHLDTDSNPAVGETVWGLPSLGCRVQRLDVGDLAAVPVPEGPTVLVARQATRHEEVWRWVRDVLAGNGQAWLVELGWPDPRLDGLDRVIRTYGASAASTDALARALRGPR